MSGPSGGNQPKVELNSLTDEILIKIFFYLDFKTRHNTVPLVCLRWSSLVRSNELWREIQVVPNEESLICEGPISQSKVFRWCSRPHVRPYIECLKLVGVGSDHDDFTPVGLGALFGICCSALRKLELQATRALLTDLSCLLCLFNIRELSLSCVDPDPLNAFHGSDVECIAGLSKLEELVFDLNLVLVPKDLGRLEALRKLSVTGTGSTPLIVPDQLAALVNLEKFTVKNPLWAEIPDVVYRFPQLKAFEIRGHPFFAHNIGFSPSALKMSHLETLGIVAHQLIKIPEQIGDMVFLRHLNLSKNSFDERLPTEEIFPFRKLGRLESLDLSYCELTQLPYSLKFLVSLIELNLSGNKLKHMSDVLSNCLHLEKLLMRDCGLESVPLQVSEIPHLEYLDISNNPVTSPDGLTDLLRRERFKSLVFCQEKWNPDLVSSACRMARIWGKREPIVG